MFNFFKKEQHPTPDELKARFQQKIDAEPNLFFIPKLYEAFPEIELFLVGGMVRDTILDPQIKSKDYDLIARNVSVDKLIAFFEPLGAIDLVGRNFGVLKFMTPQMIENEEEAIEIALPRKEFSENTGGYREFLAG